MATNNPTRSDSEVGELCSEIEIVIDRAARHGALLRSFVPGTASCEAAADAVAELLVRLHLARLALDIALCGTGAQTVSDRRSRHTADATRRHLDAACTEAHAALADATPGVEVDGPVPDVA